MIQTAFQDKTEFYLSFEREFGKVIGSLDVLSKIVADKTDRTVVKAIQSLATAVFLPIK
jgi:hypothetical protein